MAVTLGRLCENAQRMFGMHVLAGNQGMQTRVLWVHTLEDEEVSGFLHGGELVFTTGIGHQGTEWLLSFTQSLYGAEASGLVINYGPYIEKVPMEVIQYCNEVQFPLLVVPWETRLVDITRDFCNQIIQDEKQEETIQEAVRKIIQYPQELEQNLPTLERHNFQRKNRYCILLIDMKTQDNSYRGHVKFQVERLLTQNQLSYVSLIQDGSMVFLLSDCDDASKERMIQKIQALNYGKEISNSIYIGVGPNEEDIQNIAANYHKARVVLYLGMKQKQTVCSFDELGMLQLLIAVEDQNVLKKYYEDTLGRLELYDIQNQTAYVQLLETYLENDGSIQQVAELNYIHRNTVTYQLNKIRKILGSDFNTLGERFCLMMAYEVKKLL